MPEWVAAVAAVVAAVLVGWQSWETRKSAAASAEAATTANASIELTRSALEIARTEEGHTRTLIDEATKARLEAVKARIDVATPKITLLVDRKPGWPPMAPAVGSGVLEPVAPGTTVYRLPGDGLRKLTVRQSFSLLNENDRTVLLVMDSWTEQSPVASPRNEGLYELAPNVRVAGYYDIEFTIDQWAEIARRSRSDAEQLWHQFAIRFTDGSDTGVIDSYIIQMTGSPLNPAPGETDSWRVSNTPSIPPGISAVRRPMNRRYFLSITRSVEIE